MYTTLDSKTAKLYGVDNELCRPYKSTSFWALMLVYALDILQFIRHITGNYYLFITLAIIASAAVILLVLIQIQIHALARKTDIADSLNRLRVVSIMARSVVGATLMACLTTVYFLK